MTTDVYGSFSGPLDIIYPVTSRNEFSQTEGKYYGKALPKQWWAQLQESCSDVFGYICNLSEMKYSLFWSHMTYFPYLCDK